VHLSGQHVTDRDLASLRDLPDLHELAITDAPITDAGLEYLLHLHRLRWLWLGRTGITDRGLEALSPLRLIGLSVIGTAITDDGILRFARLLPRPARSGGVFCLWVANTSVTEAGIRRVYEEVPWLSQDSIVR